MTPDEIAQLADWVQHKDIQKVFAAKEIPHPWFTVYRILREPSYEYYTTWYSGLIPIERIKERLTDKSWDIHLTDGRPSIWQHYDGGEISRSVYCRFGNEEGFEPLVILRDFHGIRKGFMELSQEFCLYHNLWSDTAKKRYLQIDDDGNDSEAVRYGDDFFEIRTDLLLQFCRVKKMALGMFVDSTRKAKQTLDNLGLKEDGKSFSGSNSAYHLATSPDDYSLDEAFKMVGHFIGKRYFIPEDKPKDSQRRKGNRYQEFIIGSDPEGNPVKYTSDPEKLADFFGKNPEAPNYLTAVYFRPEVLSKYYADPQKYSVEDGYLRCGSLWGLRMDNDHTEYISIWLGDLGRDLSDAERDYWLSFNVAPQGRTISKTNYERAFLAQFADPEKPDLAFKHEYKQFREQFKKLKGWDFFLPLHGDDEHFLISLRLPSKDNQAEFDSQLIALTKVLVDSLNETEIVKGLTSLTKDDKGITKLEKFFKEQKVIGYEPHVKMLRVLQELRSKSAAHRKGSSYDKLVNSLQMKDEGQQKVFYRLLVASTNLIRYLEESLLTE